MIIRMRFRAWLCGLLGLPLLFTGCATPTGASTYSMVIRARSGTVRYIEGHHEFRKLERYSSIRYSR